MEHIQTDIQTARATYAAIRSEYVSRSVLNTSTAFDHHARYRVTQIVDNRLRAAQRHYISAERAMEARDSGRAYPNESIPTPADWVDAAVLVLRSWDYTARPYSRKGKRRGRRRRFCGNY